MPKSNRKTKPAPPEPRPPVELLTEAFPLFSTADYSDQSGFRRYLISRDHFWAMVSKRDGAPSWDINGGTDYDDDPDAYYQSIRYHDLTDEDAFALSNALREAIVLRRMLNAKDRIALDPTP